MQTKRNSTRRSLLVSATALILSIAMLVGTTFAWFTDTVSSGVNAIKAGNLDIELFHTSRTNPTEQKVDEETMLFTDVSLWEPGAVAYENFSIQNVGTLALKYQFGFSQLEANKNYNFVVEPNQTTTNKSLLDVLYVYQFDGELTEAQARALTAADGIKLSTYLSSGMISMGQFKANEGKKVGVAIYWPNQENDNAYNISNGRTTTALKDENGHDISGTTNKLLITFPVQLHATQYTYEKDSFDNQYDASAGIDAVWGGITTVDSSIAVVSNEDNTIAVSEGTTELASVTVPGDELDGVEQLNLTVTKANTEIANPVVTVSAGNNSKTFDVELVDQDGNKVTTSNAPMKVTLNIGVVDLQQFYHKGTPLRRVETESGVDTVGEYFYDTTTGKVTYMTNSFSPFTAVYKFDGGLGTETSPYLLSNAEDLKNLASLVNAGTSYERTYFSVVNNIDLKNEEWTPIGQKEGNKFKGVFDGNNKTISGLSITENNVAVTDPNFDHYVGLFGAIDGGTVKNLTVSGAVKGKAAAGIVARMESGLIENCTSNVTVEGTNNGKAGGIVCLANVNECTIKNCNNYGKVSGITTGGVAGIAAYVNKNTTIENCTNHADVGSATDRYSGGIAGYLTTGAAINIKGCENKGAVVAYEQAGGIVGITTQVSIIENCTNSGAISAGDGGFAGGIAGSTSQSTVKNCKNTATVHGKFAGGVIGNDAQSTIEKCSGGTAAITSPAHTIGFTGQAFTLNVQENGSSGRILGAHQGAGPNKYTILILDDHNGDNNTIPTVGICGNTTTMPLLKIQSGTFYGEPLAGNGSAIFLENNAIWGSRAAGKYCRGGVVEASRIESWTLQQS